MAARITPDNWTASAWSHHAVMDMQARLDPVRMTRLADDWQLAVDRIRDILVSLDRELAAQLDRSWRGRGADASTDALRRYVAGSLGGLGACRSAATHLSELSTAAADLRAVITLQHLDAALAQVRQLYSAPAVAAGNAVEDIPAPPDPFPTAGPPAANTLPTAASRAGNPRGVIQPSTAPTAPVPALAAVGDPRHDEPSPAMRSEPLWRAPTHSAALSSPPLDDPLLPRLDAPPAATSPPVAGLPPAAPIGSPRLAPAAPPSSTMPFMGGMYPGHMARDGGGEHRTPRYLMSAGNSNELIGDLPLVAPPVIGE